MSKPTLFESNSSFLSLVHNSFEKDDLFMLKLIFAQWILLLAISALLYQNFLFGFVNGGILFILSFLSYRYFAQIFPFRYIVALVLSAFTILLIQVSFGRIEMHFYIFVLLSFLIIYKDIFPLALTSLIIIIHHLIFNYLQQYHVTIFDTPIIVFNYGCGLDIVLLHAFFVIFEFIVLVKIIYYMQQDKIELIRSRNALNSLNTNLENMVAIRTKELEHARKEAITANRMKSEFLANMSHEIRTPMNAVIGFTDLLTKMKLEPIVTNYIQSIKESSKLLLALINDILDLSKVEAGKLTLEIVPTDMKLMAQEIKSVFMLKAKSLHLRFDVVVDPQLSEAILIDEIRVKQILFNLISNALKFTHTGGVTVDIKANKHQSDEMIDLMLSVIDTGIGIPESEQKKIFEAFTQQKQQSTKIYGGTGLGLTIVNKLTALMQGSVTLVSTPQKGSTFTVTIKGISTTRKNAQIIEAQSGHIIFEKACILIVDDVDINRTLIKEFLKHEPFTLFYAKNGEEAVEIADSEPLDLILMDVKMPIMDGYEASARIKRSQKLPILALTASVIESEKDPRNSIFDAFLQKPIIYDSLINELSHFLHCEKIAEPEPSKRPEPTHFRFASFEAHCPNLRQKHTAVSKSGDMQAIGSFADTLLSCAKKLKDSTLENFAQALHIAVESFDVSETEALLARWE